MLSNIYLVGLYRLKRVEFPNCYRCCIYIYIYAEIQFHINFKLGSLFYANNQGKTHIETHTRVNFIWSNFKEIMLN